MNQFYNEMLNMISQYYGESVVLLLGIISGVYLLVDDRHGRIRFLYPVIMIAACVYNPILYDRLFRDNIYWRMMWLLPTGILIAWASVRLLQRKNPGFVKVIVLAVILSVIFLKGFYIYKNDVFSENTNVAKISASAKAVANVMLARSSHPTCIVPEGLFIELRQYSGDIEMMFGRNVMGYINEPDPVCNRVAKELMSPVPDYAFIFGVANLRKYEYVVTYGGRPVLREILSEYGYTKLKSVKGYVIYRNKNVKNRDLNGWVVTQYATGAEYSACYTVEDTDNHLIIIGGGYDWWTPKLEAIIRSHDNHVAAWILPSVHTGYLEGFNNIMEKGDVVVDHVYAMDVSQERLDLIIGENEWGIYDADAAVECQQYLDMMEERVTYVQAGVDYDVFGLNMHVIHVWDDMVDSIGQAYINNGSMVFTLDGVEQKMLFCTGTVGLLKDHLLEEGDGFLDVDYVQVNNHGEWCLWYDFYDIVTPQVAFFDCYLDILDPELIRSHVWELYSYMYDKQVMSYFYDNTVNWVLLK